MARLRVGHEVGTALTLSLYATAARYVTSFDGTTVPPLAA
jgi:hypothetical protein